MTVPQVSIITQNVMTSVTTGAVPTVSLRETVATTLNTTTYTYDQSSLTYDQSGVYYDNVVLTAGDNAPSVVQVIL